MYKERKFYKILVVEDNSGDMLLIEDYLLERIKYPKITNTKTFREAERFLKEEKHSFDAILLDLSLPDNSGEDLIKEILHLADSTPVIVLTGYTDMDFGVRSLTLGVSDYLLKDELSSTSLFKSILYSIERKEIFKQLQDSETRYRDLFHLSPLPMWLYDLETLEFLDVNRAAVVHYGYSKEEFLRMTLKNINPEEGIQEPENSKPKVDEKKQYVSGDIYRHRKKDGEIIYVEIKGNVVVHNERKAEVILVNDITERLTYINAIEEQNQRLQEIAWIQSHIVRAPLARLMGLVDILDNMDEEEKPHQNKYLKMIMASALELDEIIKDIATKTDKINLKLGNQSIGNK